LSLCPGYEGLAWSVVVDRLIPGAAKLIRRSLASIHRTSPTKPRSDSRSSEPAGSEERAGRIERKRIDERLSRRVADIQMREQAEIGDDSAGILKVCSCVAVEVRHLR
jgi:hypothetical protein